jgi:LysM repeat protein
MYQNEIKDLPSLPDERYENIFQVFQDENNRYFYNLLETINFPENLPDGFFTTYVVQPGDTYPYISYKLFKTINVWWAICLVNEITNPTLPLEPGTVLKVPTLNTIREIIRQINLQ